MTVWAPMQHCAYVFLSLNSHVHAKVFKTSGVFWMLYLTQTAYMSVWKWLISLNSQAGRAALKLEYLYATESPLETFIVVLARAGQLFKTFLITCKFPYVSKRLSESHGNTFPVGPTGWLHVCSWSYLFMKISKTWCFFTAWLPVCYKSHTSVSHLACVNNAQSDETQDLRDKISLFSLQTSWWHRPLPPLHLDDRCKASWDCL